MLRSVRGFRLVQQYVSQSNTKSKQIRFSADQSLLDNLAEGKQTPFSPPDIIPTPTPFSSIWPTSKAFRDYNLSSTRNRTAESVTLAVCILDPRENSRAAAIHIKVPSAFLPCIARGQFEVGEGDEPTNSYNFGKRSEFFQQTFSGQCKCQSGYVGIKLVESVQQENSSQDWAQLKARIDSETISFPDHESGLLFAGPVVQADSVSVYKLVESGRITGLLLSADV